MKNETNVVCVFYMFLGAFFVSMTAHGIVTGLAMFLGIGFLSALFLKAVNGVVTEIRSICKLNNLNVDERK
jgi:hypothetical protein